MNKTGWAMEKSQNGMGSRETKGLALVEGNENFSSDIRAVIDGTENALEK